MVETVLLTGSGATGFIVNEAHRMAVAQLPVTVKLGRKPPLIGRQHAHMAKYFDVGQMTTPPPTSINRRDKAAVSIARMYRNDVKGCCVVSGKGHLFGVLSANDSDSSGILLATDQQIDQQYAQWCGPGDNGCVITDVLDQIQRNGMKLGNAVAKIDGYVAADWTNKLMVQVVQYIFAASTIGINLPGAWMNSDIWDVTNSSIVGGHDVTPIDYDEQYVYVSSWGRIYRMTWAAFMSRRWVEEYYAIKAPAYYNADKVSGSGIAESVLTQDLALIGSGQIPSIDPPTPIPPTPPVPPVPPPVASVGALKVTRPAQSGGYHHAMGAQSMVLTANGGILAIGDYDIVPSSSRKQGFAWGKLLVLLADAESIVAIVGADSVDVIKLYGDIVSRNVSALVADMTALEADYPAAETAVQKFLTDLKS